MVNYQLGKVYKVVDNTNQNIYVGSTCKEYLSQRLAGHVSNYKRYLKVKKGYTTSFDIIKNNDYEIVLLESYPCNSKDELTARERFYIDTLDCVNTIRPFSSNDEKLKQMCDRQARYYKNKREIILQKRKDAYDKKLILIV
jgi:hypothetical protein